MKKIILLFLFIIGGLFMNSCVEETKEATPTPKPEPTVEPTLEPTTEQKTEEPEEVYTTIVKNLEDIEIEVGETYTFYYIVKSNKDLTISSLDDSIVSVKDNVLTGVKAGKTEILLSKNNEKQKVPVQVFENGELSQTFSFTKERLAGKKIVAFGDSVTANATIGGEKTYFNLFADKFKMVTGKNYAIGGTTATYMYEGSNIYKEYAGNEIAIDGVRVVKKAYDANELADVDYAFIAYGHNDQYFQPPIIAAGDDEYNVNSFDSCHSFKGSYRYMINTLKLANPNVRIILLNCTYSEYDKSNPSKYGKLFNYGDYRMAVMELAEEFGLTCIDPWDYMQPYFDVFDNKLYYKDTVHLSSEGHKILAEYICNYREEE